MIPLSFLFLLILREFNQGLRWVKGWVTDSNSKKDVGFCYPFARIIESRGVDERHAAATLVKVFILSDLGCSRVMSNFNKFVASQSPNELSFLLRTYWKASPTSFHCLLDPRFWNAQVWSIYSLRNKWRNLRTQWWYSMDSRICFLASLVSGASRSTIARGIQIATERASELGQHAKK